MMIKRGLIIVWASIQLTHCIDISFNKTLNVGVADLSRRLNQYAENYLGIKKLQEHFNKTIEKNKRLNGEEIVKKFQENLSKKIQNAREALKPIKDFIVESHATSEGSDERSVQSCCVYEDKQLHFSYSFNAWVNFKDICEYAPTKCSSSQPLDKVHLLKKQKAIELFKNAYEEHGIAKSRHLYYGGKDGYFVAYPAQNSNREECQCKAFDPRFRPWFIDTINKNAGKEIVFVIDFSSRMSKLEKYVKMFAKNILGVVDAKDKIYLKLITTDTTKIERPPCMEKLVEAYTSITNTMKSVIENTQLQGNLEGSFIKDAFDKFETDTAKEKVFILMTSGNYDNNADVKAQLKEAVRHWNCSVLVNIFLWPDQTEGGVRNTIHEFHVEMIDTACEQCQSCDTKKIRLIRQEIDISTMTEVDIRSDIAKLYDSFYESMITEKEDDDVHFVMPYEDFYGLGTMIDACTRVMSDKKFLGVLCMSFLKNELFGITTDFTESEHQYRFLIGETGTTFVHPNYVNPGLHELAIRFDITTFETSKKFKDVYWSMKRGETNHTRILTNVSVPKGLFGAVFEEKSYQYYWHKVLNSSFSIGVVISDEHGEQLQFFDNQTNSNGGDLYHRLDVDEKNDNNFCRVGNTVSTKISSVIKLPANVFRQPAKKDEDLESKENVRSLMDYLNGDRQVDVPDHIKSPEVARHLKRSVIVTRYINSYWMKKKDEEEDLTIYRRYIGLDNGVFRMYPGQMLEPDFDPTSMPWYKIAEAHGSNGHLFFTPPFSDGHKRLLTLSAALKKTKDNLDQLAGVMGMDFELSYFRYMLKDVCSSVKTCVVVSRSGFVIYHPDFFEQGKPFRRNIHLIEKEPFIAQSMIEEKLMEKNSCVEYNNAAPRVIWFYNVDAVREVKKISAYVHYWLVSIPTTNLLLLTIQQNIDQPISQCTCESAKIEGDLPECKLSYLKNSCECPCFERKICFSQIPRSESLICRPSKISGTIHSQQNGPPIVDIENLGECFPKHCNKFKNKEQCEKIGCYFSKEECIEFSASTPTLTPAPGSFSYGAVIGIGCVVGVIIVIAILVVIFKRIKPNRRKECTVIFKNPPAPPPEPKTDSFDV